MTAVRNAHCARGNPSSGRGDNAHLHHAHNAHARRTRPGRGWPPPGHEPQPRRRFTCLGSCIGDNP
eukprot:9334744-Lingulodinium_polyedra.AAC.1